MAADIRNLPSTFDPNEPGYQVEAQAFKISTHGAIPLPLGMRIIFINGILNSPKDAQASAIDISQSIGNRKVHWVYNAPLGADSKVITLATPETANSLAEKILQKSRKCRSELDAGARTTHKICIVIIAHSHGAAVLELALADRRLTVELKRDIRIITIGGAALIPSSFCCSRNLINDLDLVPLITHKTLEPSPIPDDSPFSQRLAYEVKAFIAEFKEKLQKDILNISSGEKTALGERIVSEMIAHWRSSPHDTPLAKIVIEMITLWESSPHDTPLAKQISAFSQNSTKIIEEHLPSGPLSMNEFIDQFVHVFFALATHALPVIEAGLTETCFLIEILRTLPKFVPEVLKDLVVPHCVPAYAYSGSRLSNLILGYIDEHEAQVPAIPAEDGTGSI